MKSILSLMVVAGMTCAAQAQIWDEFANGGGDAGDLAGTAQMTAGVGALNVITGDYEANGIDLFAIRIADPAGFAALYVTPTTFDTQMYLFDINGNGVAFNDDRSGLLSGLMGSDTFTSNGSGTLAGVLVAGDCYLLGVSRYNRDPRDAGNLAIFPNTFTGVHGPIPGSGSLAAWANATTAGGAYAIELRGVEYCVPAPGAAALLGLGGLIAGRRRR